MSKTNKSTSGTLWEEGLPPACVSIRTEYITCVMCVFFRHDVWPHYPQPAGGLHPGSAGIPERGYPLSL